MADPIRIAVIDDHPLFRQGAVQALTNTCGIEVVGEGATAADALKLAQDLAPDIILLDVVLPGGGVEAAAGIARHCPRVRTVMLTASEDAQHVASALQAGARGYILKGSSESELVETVRAVFCGECYVAPSLGARLLMQTRKRVEIIASDDMRNLTSREEEILLLVSRGKTNKEIANGLNCTERTVKHHMTNIMRKSNVRNRVEAVLKFRQRANVGPISAGSEYADAREPAIRT
jgi:two-component system, NarL family, nitrate/nitrite response regulator NarL